MTLTRNEAFEEMKKGNKVRHIYFADYEYYQLKGTQIIAEDGVNHTSVFWSTNDGDFRKDGWEIIKPL